jgi:AmmeMemoRadiSam system protein A
MDAAIPDRLLKLARWTLETWSRDEDWRRGGPTLTADEDRPVDGLFVTLTRADGSLRGCIGTLAAQPSLDRALRETAVSAAGADPRFPPVKGEELAGLRIAVSILSPMEPLAEPESVEIGRDGLVIERGGRRGLFLPEVPVEAGWDRERYLEELCHKAFLPPGAWRDPASRLYRFTTRQFSEAAGPAEA